MYIIYLYKSSVIYISCFLITWYFILLGSVLWKGEIFSNTLCLISLSAPQERQDPCAQSVCQYPIMGAHHWTIPLDWRVAQMSCSKSHTKYKNSSQVFTPLPPAGAPSTLEGLTLTANRIRFFISEIVRF